MKYLALALAFCYSLSPFDLIPDFIFGGGWIDDILVWILALRFFFTHSGKIAQEKSAYKQRHREADEDDLSGNRESSGNNQQQTRTSHEIMGVSKDASLNEIKAAYLKLVNKYHPDKVDHLGKEFQVLAEERFKEIQKAYHELTRR